MYSRGFPIIVHKISYFFSWVAAIALFLMMGITTVDVFGRYLFNHPVIGAQDLIEISMIFLVYGAIGLTTLTRSHIRADVLESVLSRKKYAIMSAINMGIAMVVTIVFIWQTSIKAGDNLKDLALVTGVLRIPIAPFYVFATFGLIVMGFELLFDVDRYLKDAREEPDTKNTDG